MGPFGRGGSAFMESGEMVGQSLGHYYITGLIGRGGMATVFLARDMYLNRVVALKVFRPRADAQDVFLRRFEREAQVVARLEHPNILVVYEYGRYEGKAFFAMPYLSYGSLRSYLQSQRKLSMRASVELLVPILRALQYAHERGLIHRDIKPDNLLFKADHSLVLSDFGLVKVLTAEYDTVALSSFVTHTTSIMGTPQYMSPEQIQGRAVPASDIYSLGVVLYEMLTGHIPFVAETAIHMMTMHLYEQPRPLREINPAISQELEDVVLRSLEKDATRRYQRPLDFLEALLEVVNINPAIAANEPPVGHHTTRLASKMPNNPVLIPGDTEAASKRANYVVDHNSFAALHVPTPIRKQTQLSTAVLPATLARYTTHKQPSQQSSVSRFISLIFLIGLLALVPLGILWSLPIILSSTHHLPAVASGCPASGQARNAVLPPISQASTDVQTRQQEVVYVQQTEVQAGSADALMSYNAETGMTTRIKVLPDVNVSSAQISPDGQWIVFVASSAHQSQLQLLRIDGSLLQTLYCMPTSNPTDPSIQAIHWSPYSYYDSARLLFTATPDTQIYQLFLYNGTLHHERTLPPDDQIVGWRDAHHVYLRKDTMSSALYQIAVSDEKTTVKSSLQVVAPTDNSSCDAYAVGTQTGVQSVTYISHCASSISILGAERPFFDSPSMALSQFCLADSTLLAVSNAKHPSASLPNGLWSIDTKKTLPQPKLLAQIDRNQYRPILNTSSQDSWSNVSRNGHFYALKLQSVGDTGDTILALGSLTGGTSQNIVTAPTGAYLSLVGWTTSL